MAYFILVSRQHRGYNRNGIDFLLDCKVYRPSLGWSRKIQLASTFNALSTHRLWPGSENSLKIMHLIFMVVVLVCLVVAFAIVVDFVKGHHFSTLHGWLGLIFSVIIIIEVPVFLIVFGFNISKDSRSKLMKWHIKSTFVILLLSLAVSLTGFQGHILTHNYNEITIINLTGLVIFLFITIVTYVLMVEGSGN
ncbi:uncharacterized protein isoform X4 [Rhodnius prolixus]|uniref:uncharacterized protein isoform X4 n=1 Tax=Rhodnius prolixus TaxID=13249 RepID=UPI003D189E12